MEAENWCCEMKQNKAAGPEFVPPVGATASQGWLPGNGAREELLWFQSWDGMEAQGGGER